MGNAEYNPETSSIAWTLKTLTGGKEALLRAKFGMPSVKAESDTENVFAKTPATAQFEIPYLAVSGVQVKYLKVIEKSGYQALPWVRYITTAGEYETRIKDRKM